LGDNGDRRKGGYGGSADISVAATSASMFNLVDDICGQHELAGFHGNVGASFFVLLLIS